jgi:copper chaperone CopZ
MRRLLLTATFVAMFAGCSQQGSETSFAEPDQITTASFNTAGAPTVEFSVPDMMCPEGCAVEVKEILAKQPGAKDVLVDFEAKTATVAVEQEEFDSAQALAALIDKQFTNSSLKDAANADPQAAAESAVQ